MTTNGAAKLTLSPNGATIFIGVLVAALLETIHTPEELETRVASLTKYWSIAQERPAGQVVFSAATDEHNIHVLMDGLIAHLRGSYAL